MSTFVTVGNMKLPFTRLLDAVTGAMDLLPKPVVVQYGHNEFGCQDCRAEAFFEMQAFAEAMASSDLIIMHGGAGSLIHALRASKRPIVMPRLATHGEHVDDHQLEIAGVFAQMGRLQLCSKPDELRKLVEGNKAQSMADTEPSVAPASQIVADRLEAIQRRCASRSRGR